ncbi:Domain of unknown function (DUF1995 [Striga hermonthica]|uniref:DUF1995 domain-containing protein n=1 Tax=Striga hermonthica TaxID=68872 RepID=A0A9N7RPV9_STRHE|nr:Domain of unknown function (DUF1995 [Striga hermonthica]
MTSATYPIPTLAASVPRRLSFFVTHCSSNLYRSKACGFDGFSRLRSVYGSTTLAKFDKFQGGRDNFEQDNPQQVEEFEEDDSCLPSDLEGAVHQSGQASAEFISSGGMRAIVELLIPQLQFLDNEGAQAELWELSKIFMDTLIEETGGQMASATYPIPTLAASVPRRLSFFVTHCSSNLYRSKACGFDGFSRLRSVYGSTTLAKFDKFQGGRDNFEQDNPQQVEEFEEDDSCLPSDLEGAVHQSGQASAEFISSGGMRAIVELLIPQLQFLDNEGAQAELWELSKIFLDTLIEETGGQVGL